MFVDHALIEVIELRSSLLLKVAIAGNGSKQACGQWRIDAFEQLQEHEADRVTAGRRYRREWYRFSKSAPWL